MSLPELYRGLRPRDTSLASGVPSMVLKVNARNLGDPQRDVEAEEEVNKGTTAKIGSNKLLNSKGETKSQLRKSEQSIVVKRPRNGGGEEFQGLKLRARRGCLSDAKVRSVPNGTGRRDIPDGISHSGNKCHTQRWRNSQRQS